MTGVQTCALPISPDGYVARLIAIPVVSVATLVKAGLGNDGATTDDWHEPNLRQRIVTGHWHCDADCVRVFACAIARSNFSPSTRWLRKSLPQGRGWRQKFIGSRSAISSSGEHNIKRYRHPDLL